MDIKRNSSEQSIGAFLSLAFLSLSLCQSFCVWEGQKAGTILSRGGVVRAGVEVCDKHSPHPQILISGEKLLCSQEVK